MGECCTLLHPIVLQENVNDNSLWKLHVSKNYNVSSVYNFLLSVDQIITVDDYNFIWRKKVSLNVSIFVWRLLRNDIPTTDNFIIKGVNMIATKLCADDCGKAEGVDHLCIHCDFFNQLWSSVLNWLGFFLVTPLRLSDHHLQFGAFGSFSTKNRSVILFNLVINGLDHLERKKC